jgi:hypothetical protein
VGEKFSSLNELEGAISQYESQHYCQLWKRDTRTSDATSKRVPKRVESTNKGLKYYSLKLSCKFGGKASLQRENKTRVSSSFRQCCLFEIYLMLSLDGQALEFSKVHDEHKHQISCELFNHLPRQRRLVGQDKEEIKEAIRLKQTTNLSNKRLNYQLAAL